METLRSSDPERFESWLAHVRTALPDLRSVETIERPEDRHRYLRIVYETGHKAPSWTVSEGSGQERRTAEEVTADLSRRLRASGWDDRAEVLVIEPELEIWIWSDSPEVDCALRWKKGSLRHWMAERQLWPEGERISEFLKGALDLEVEEYDTRSPIGITVPARLEEMLSVSSFAIIVMSAEDQRKDGMLQARQNVIHEAGLSQGRLGFEKVAILRHKDCEKFSNLSGINEIEYDAANLGEACQKIRRVLEREGLVGKSTS